MTEHKKVCAEAGHVRNGAHTQILKVISNPAYPEDNQQSIAVRRQ